LRAGSAESSAHFAAGREAGHAVELPCTLLCRNERVTVRADTCAVRGALVVQSSGPGRLRVLNIVDVEQ